MIAFLDLAVAYAATSCSLLCGLVGAAAIVEALDRRTRASRLPRATAKERK